MQQSVRSIANHRNSLPCRGSSLRKLGSNHSWLERFRNPIDLARGEGGRGHRSRHVPPSPAGAVEPIFLQWLDQKLPYAKDRVLSRIRSTRKGELHQNNFGERMRGDGPIALQIRQTFEVFRMKYQLDAKGATIDTSKFYRPTLSNGQRMLF